MGNNDRLNLNALNNKFGCYSLNVFNPGFVTYNWEGGIYFIIVRYGKDMKKPYILTILMIFSYICQISLL